MVSADTTFEAKHTDFICIVTFTKTKHPTNCMYQHLQYPAFSQNVSVKDTQNTKTRYTIKTYFRCPPKYEINHLVVAYFTFLNIEAVHSILSVYTVFYLL